MNTIEISLENKIDLILDWLSLQPEQKSKYRNLKNAYTNATAYEESNQSDFEKVFYFLLEEGYIESDDDNNYHLISRPRLSNKQQNSMASIVPVEEQGRNEDQQFTSFDVLRQAPSFAEIIQTLEISEIDHTLFRFRFDERLSKSIPLKEQRVPLDDDIYKVRDEVYGAFFLVINNQVRVIPSRKDNPDMFNICYTFIHAKTSPVFRYVSSTKELHQLKPFVPSILIRLLIMSEPELQEVTKTHRGGFRTFYGISQEVVREIQRIICKSAVEIIK